MDESAGADLLVEREVQRALTRYARGVDRHDEALIVSAFHADALARHGTFVGRPAALARWLNRVHARYTRGHQHRLTNFTIEIDGDVVHAETYVHFVLWRRRDGAVESNGGRYVDRFERRDGAWRIADRTVVIDWLSETAAGTDPDGALGAYVWGAWDGTDLSRTRDPSVPRNEARAAAG